MQPESLCPLTDEQKRLAESCINLTRKKVGEFLRKAPYVDHAEAESEALLALCNAARCFDPARGFAFTTYVCSIVPRMLWRLAKEARRPRPANLNDVALATIPARDAGVKSNPRGTIDEAVEAIPGESGRRWARMRFVDLMTWADIARAEGRPVETVTNVVKKAINRLYERSKATCRGTRKKRTV